MSSRKSKRSTKPKTRADTTRARKAVRRSAHVGSGLGWRARLLIPVVCLLMIGVAGSLLWRRQSRLLVPLAIHPRNFERFDDQIRAYINSFIKTVELDPGDARTHAQLGLVYGANDLWHEANLCFQAASRLDPGEVMTIYYQAVAERKLGRTDMALERLAETTTLFPGYVPAHHHTGVLLLSRGDIAGAEAAFARVIALAPGGFEGHTGMGEARLRAGDQEQAVAFFQKALQLKPSSRRTHYLLGIAYLKTGRREEAAEHLARGIGGEAKYMPDAWTYDLGRHSRTLADQIDFAFRQLDAGSPEVGAELLEEALSWHPGNVDILNNLAVIYLKTGEMERAEDLLQQAVRQDDRRFETYINLAVLRLEIGDPNLALAEADRAVALAPLVGNAHSVRGRALKVLRRFDEALYAFEKAIDCDAEDIGSVLEVANLSFRAGLYDEAREHFDIILESDPRNFAAKLFSCVCTIRLGERDAAAVCIEGARRLDPAHEDLVRLERDFRARFDGEGG